MKGVFKLKESKFYQKVLQFNEKLSKISLSLPNGYRIVNPFIGKSNGNSNTISWLFCNKNES